MLILIYDHDKQSGKKLGQLCQIYFKNITNITILSVNNSSDLQYFYQHIPDIIFVNLQIPYTTDPLYYQISQFRYLNTIIIYILDENNSTHEFFAFHIRGYLKKPITKLNLYPLLDKACAILQKSYSQHDIFKLLNKKLNYEDIYYIKANDKYSEIYLSEERYLIRKTLKDWHIILENYHFCQPHKSYIINMKYIINISNIITLSNNITIPISHAKIKFIKELYLNYTISNNLL